MNEGVGKKHVRDPLMPPNQFTYLVQCCSKVTFLTMPCHGGQLRGDGEKRYA